MSENSIYTEQVQCPYCHEVIKAPNQPGVTFLCPNCGKELVTFDKQKANSVESTSPEYEEEPPEIDRWNWGTFYFSWLWGIVHGIYWPLVLAIAIGLLVLVADTGYIDILATIASIVISVILGINGNRWAWEEKYWASIADFSRTQHKWDVAGLCAFIVSVVCGIIFLILFSQFAMLMKLT